MRKELSEFSKYKEIVKNYIETGVIPNNVKKSQLIARIKILTPEERRSLRDLIEMERPQDDFAYIGPVLEAMPSAGKWAVLAGVASGGAQYQFSRDVYSATATGLLTSAVTFLGQLQYKKNQTKTMYDKIEQRGKEFLQHLSQLVISIDYPQVSIKYSMEL